MEKKSSPRENRTLAKGFRVPCANHYTIGLTTKNHHINFQLKPEIRVELRFFIQTSSQSLFRFSYHSKCQCKSKINPEEFWLSNTIPITFIWV